MIRRIDVVKNEDGDYELVFDGEVLDSGSKIKNWIIEIKFQQIFCVGLSNARKTDERIKIYPLEEGSLFLYNSSYNWYSYFRKNEIQDVLDKFNIIKCKSCDSDYVKIVIENYSPDNIPQFKVFGYELYDIIQNIESEDEEITEEITLRGKTLVFKKEWMAKNSFILQKGKNEESYILYMDRDSLLNNLKLEDAVSVDVYKEIESLN